MSSSTALGAKGDGLQIVFSGKQHENFFFAAMVKADIFDVHHQALFYCLGISEDTRNHVGEIYDFKERTINPDCLSKGWITSGSGKILRMAFNLFCGCSPSVDEEGSQREAMREYERYTPEDLFCCGYAKYFWQAIKLRYPEYCN